MNWLQYLISLFKRKTPKPAPPVAPPVAPKPDVPVGDLDPDGYIILINGARVRDGLRALAASAQANAAAAIQSHWQAQRDQIGHDGPPGLPWPADRLAAQGITNVACGEIAAEGEIAYWPPGTIGTVDGKQVDIGGTIAINYDFGTSVEDWLKSPGHRAILLGSQWSFVGAAMATSSSGKMYATAVFY